jgi:hypothetical protein
MKLSTLLNDIAESIATDAAIEAFCQANFNKSISVYVHIDPKNPPSINLAPWVGLTIQGYRRVTDMNLLTMDFDIESAVFCSESKKTTVGNIVTMNGFNVLEDLSDLVFAVVEGCISTSLTQLNITFSDEQQTALMISDFPGWIASRIWTASKHI